MVYALCFSIAYIHLEAGTGALLLFGAVQLSMVAHGLVHGEVLGWQRLSGLVLAVGGITVLLLPGAQTPPLFSSFLMVCSGFAWAAYTISGRKVRNASAATTANFILAVPMAIGLSLLLERSPDFDETGVLLAILSGSLASAGSYVLWYSIIPHLESVTASTIQLSVPCLALAGGTWILGEHLSLRIILSSCTVLAGILLVVRADKRR
ncbi:DMT family transporter, partial [Citrobacter amalonaticus]|nr:DMT family transporter [Citrobacter amalonaticus]